MWPVPKAVNIALAALLSHPGCSSNHTQLADWLFLGSDRSALQAHRILDISRSSAGSLPFTYHTDRRMVEELNVPQRFFSSKEDYRVDPLKLWSEQVGAHSRRVENVHIISSADYLRFTAWTLDRDVSHRKQDHSYGYYSLIHDQGIGRRKLAKALKKAAADLASAEYSDGGHQDIVMMLAGDSLMVRPASYLAIGNMQLSGTRAPESVLFHSLDTRAIVSHPTRAALAEFELMLNSSTACGGRLSGAL